MSKTFTERSLVQLTLVRFREFLREPEAIFWTFIFPILLATGLGIAFRNRPPDVLSVGASNSRLAEALKSEQTLRVDVLNEWAGNEALRMGRIVLFAAPDTSGGVKFRYDDTNPESRTARVLAERAIQRSAGVQPAIPARAEVVREPGSRYIDFLLPGLLGMNMMGNGIWGLGFGIVDARRRKLLKRLSASPMSRTEYLLSYLFFRLCLLVVEVSVVIGFGVLAFGVPLRGPLWQFALICFLSALAFSSLGLLIASRVRTIEAVSGLMNFTMLPMWVFSGVFFSAERFPDIVQPFIRALPLTAVIDALRSNMLQGAALPQLWSELAVIAAWVVVCFFSALKLFRWR